jgi:hypothetical protein
MPEPAGVPSTAAQRRDAPVFDGTLGSIVWPIPEDEFLAEYFEAPTHAMNFSDSRQQAIAALTQRGRRDWTFAALRRPRYQEMCSETHV